MQKCLGLVVNPGIAFGKIYILCNDEAIDSSVIEHPNQLEVLNKALVESTKRIEEQIQSAHRIYSDRISVIFEAHKLMMNDSMILDKAKAKIQEGFSAYEAYKQSTQEAISLFKKHPNEYLRNRIVDIEDATDRVLSSILDKEYEVVCTFDEPRILVMKKMKPSIFFNCDKDNVAGFISEEGSYNQHSGMIARTKDIPGMIISNIFEHVKDNDYILLNAFEGEVFINPEDEFVKKLLEERR
ncbi:MAG: phosphoenolpyruvate-utilizing N-terminal domain-containing protein [Candidatus Izemoplasmatales bacterium]|jgi:phosphotransferase system enzyme I (PtsI)|nr:phosphoenolpyruvate-utilizing N-terminal domain-containing protein [Candidatus Izemoplasmatales bacterium]